MAEGGGQLLYGAQWSVELNHAEVIACIVNSGSNAHSIDFSILLICKGRSGVCEVGVERFTPFIKEAPWLNGSHGTVQAYRQFRSVGNSCRHISAAAQHVIGANASRRAWSLAHQLFTISSAQSCNHPICP